VLLALNGVEIAMALGFLDARMVTSEGGWRTAEGTLHPLRLLIDVPMPFSLTIAAEDGEALELSTTHLRKSAVDSGKSSKSRRIARIQVAKG
jgi:hypothetical protein